MGHVGGQDAPERRLQPELAGERQAASGGGVPLPQPADGPERRAEVEVAADDALGVPDLLGDAAGRLELTGVEGAAPQDIEGVPLFGQGPDHPGDGQPLGGAALGLVATAGQHQPLRLVGEDAGAVGRRLGRQEPHRLLQGGQAARLVVTVPALLPQPHVQQRRAYRGRPPGRPGPAPW
jgi:hypothetical protein